MRKKAQIGMPIEIMLDGRGIRSIEFNPERNLHFIVAGPPVGPPMTWGLLHRTLGQDDRGKTRRLSVE
jgi:hypothetical protein